MTDLDDVKPGAMIRGVVPGHSVQIVSVDWIGNQAINLVYREPAGGVSETTLYRDDEKPTGHRDARPELVVRRRRQLVALGHGSEPDRARAPFRSLSCHSHQPGRPIAASDIRRLWRDAGASATALPAGRRSGGRQDDHGRAADQGAACTGRSGALPDRGSGKPRRAMAGRTRREIRSGVRHPDARHDRNLTLGQSLRRPRPADRPARHARPQ